MIRLRWLVAAVLVAPLAACHRTIDLRAPLADGGAADGGFRSSVIDSARPPDSGGADAGAPVIDALGVLPAGGAIAPGARE